MTVDVRPIGTKRDDEAALQEVGRSTGRSSKPWMSAMLRKAISGALFSRYREAGAYWIARSEPGDDSILVDQS